MPGRYIGRLSRDDPFHFYLDSQIMPQLGLAPCAAGYRVFQFPHSRDVYLYERADNGAKVVGKFHPFRPTREPHRPFKTGETEYRNLVFLRGLGFEHAPMYVVRPLGFAAHLGSVLVVEYLEGSLLSGVITAAIHSGGQNRLYAKLSGLARFLAHMHNRTAGDWRVLFDDSLGYLDRLLGSLCQKRGLPQDKADAFRGLGQAWRARARMWEDVSVLAHGDVTPSNFLFGRGREVMVIDVERMGWADRVFDLGRLCGELTHFFLQATGDPAGAEPFIGHFLWEYSGHFPDQARTFASVTSRLPFYMGITLLRIARNNWIDPAYRWRLTGEAQTILTAGLWT